MGRTASSPFSLFSACMLVVCLRLRHLRECWSSRRTFWNSANLWSWKHFNVPSWGYDFLAACTAYREQQLCFQDWPLSDFVPNHWFPCSGCQLHCTQKTDWSLVGFCDAVFAKCLRAAWYCIGFKSLREGVCDKQGSA